MGTPWKKLGLWAVVMALVGAWGAGCSCSSTSDPGDGGQGGDGAGVGGAGGAIFAGTGGETSTDALEVLPAGEVIEAVFGTAGPTVQFKAVEKSSGNEVEAKWAVSVPATGTIDDAGLFTASGNAGGQITVSASRGSDVGSTTLTINLSILDNPGAVTPEEKATLEDPNGQSDPNWQLWYPYDGTVFPRGILAPEIHSSTDSMPATKFYVHIKGTNVDYAGFFAAAPQLLMSQPAWEALSNSSDGTDLAVEISKLVGGQKYGPLTQTWRVATGKLHGTIYYNTYDSLLAGGTGAMMRIKGTSTAPEVLIGNCTVCHSISADGSTAAAANHQSPTYPGGIFDLSGGNLNPPNTFASAELAAFAALFPKNGDVFVVNGAPGPSYPPNTPGTSGTWTSSLLTKTGMPVPASGIEGYYAMTPVFSPDGTMLAFTDRDATNTALSKLALMKYDAATQKFSDYQVLATPPAGRHYSWPAFTPDGKFVVFQDGTGEDLATWGSNTAKLGVVDVATQTVNMLGSLNGDGYMPQGARDENLNYEPTIAPVASGGYFWVMFTSRRTYGNRLLGTRDQTKRLWVAAFDVNAAANTDATHPAFYISGQELDSGNSRGFWALDPCKPTGQGCESGDECCEGFCNPDPSNPGTLVCSPPGECADEFESCTTAADCCDPSLQCIGGKCTQLPPS